MDHFFHGEFYAFPRCIHPQWLRNVLLQDSPSTEWVRAWKTELVVQRHLKFLWLTTDICGRALSLQCINWSKKARNKTGFMTAWTVLDNWIGDSSFYLNYKSQKVNSILTKGHALFWWVFIHHVKNFRVDQFICINGNSKIQMGKTFRIHYFKERNIG